MTATKKYLFQEKPRIDGAKPTAIATTITTNKLSTTTATKKLETNKTAIITQFIQFLILFIKKFTLVCVNVGVYEFEVGNINVGPHTKVS